VIHGRSVAVVGPDAIPSVGDSEGKEAPRCPDHWVLLATERLSSERSERPLAG
jgi:hypothetical protein